MIYQTAIRVKVRTMSSSREDLARWVAGRWFQSGEHSTEVRLEGALEELGLGIKDVTKELRRHASWPPVVFPWAEWVQRAQAEKVAVYVDASASEFEIDEQQKQGAEVGLVVQIAAEWWTLAIPLLAEFDNTTGETIGLSLERVVAKRRGEGAAGIEVVYDAQAAARILGAEGHRQRHPARRAVH